MIDYSNGKIYTIRNNKNNDLIYVGSTIDTLSSRYKSCRCPQIETQTGEWGTADDRKGGVLGRWAHTFILAKEIYVCFCPVLSCVWFSLLPYLLRLLPDFLASSRSIRISLPSFFAFPSALPLSLPVHDMNAQLFALFFSTDKSISLDSYTFSASLLLYLCLCGCASAFISLFFSTISTPSYHFFLPPESLSILPFLYSFILYLFVLKITWRSSSARSCCASIILRVPNCISSSSACNHTVQFPKISVHLMPFEEVLSNEWRATPERKTCRVQWTWQLMIGCYIQDLFHFDLALTDNQRLDIADWRRFQHCFWIGHQK